MYSSLINSIVNGIVSIAAHVIHWMYRRHQYRLAVRARQIDYLGMQEQVIRLTKNDMHCGDQNEPYCCDSSSEKAHKSSGTPHFLETPNQPPLPTATAAALGSEKKLN